MKHILILGLILSISSIGYSGVRILNKKEGQLELTGKEAKIMTKVILKAPVTVLDGYYNLSIMTTGQDFNYKEVTIVTGYIKCQQNGEQCIVKGGSIREAGDGWFSPTKGVARVFDMGTLSTLSDKVPASKSIFSCDQVYETIACDFKLN